ncbi:hypothetical protein SAMN05192558_103339 [Actinokineospora alba]|uniref:Uncharacterized protein n=1 Tax=Actinokineospora alba TaxID=504798 RepID=A0A1H0K5G7_9PSEU|nr:hypothetical protein [Actinokineospora alba]TDP68045.1 hypothetical protein C8E96_3603 [Actinokineospora alba]SDH91426.1 hypothetical protein SAMN05421871_102710 [Actinokineospora alba]SDO50990.1 hypothetical protein SAMN05192558_103339 [Actinokineospora alba]
MDHEAEARAFIADTTGWDGEAVDLALTVLRDEGTNDYHLDAKTGGPIGDIREKARRRLAEMSHLHGVSGEDPGALWLEVQQASADLMKAKSRAYANFKSGYGSPEDDAVAIEAAAHALATLWRRMAAAQAEPWRKLAAHHTASRFDSVARTAQHRKRG